MNRKPIAILLTILLICGIIPLIKLQTTVKADPITIHVPTDYPTITAAIAAATSGDTILVATGTYHEEVIVDKSLTIIGESADTTIIDGTGLTLTQRGLVTITAAGDVTFSGFTIRNAPVVPSSDDLRICLLTQSSIAGSTYTISHNKIHGSNDPNEYNDYGFYASHGKENIIFTHNLVTETSNNNIVLEQHTGSTEISHNALDAGVWGTDSIFFMTYNGVDVTTLQDVSYNTFNMGTGGPFDYDHRATGVSFCSVYPYYGTTSPAKFTNMVVSGNTFNNLQIYRRGIGFWIGGTGNDLVSPTITGNTITGVGQPLESSGIDFVGLGDISGASITHNTITGTAAGIILWSGDASGTTINYNDIVGNTMGLNWTGSLADARFNWWGSATGPNPTGSGDRWMGNANIANWLNSPFQRLYTSPNPISKAYGDVGTNFNLDVNIESITDLYGFDIKLTWDSSLITLTQVDYTAKFDALWGAGHWSLAQDVIGVGTYRIVAYAFAPAVGFTGDDTLFTLTFHIQKGSNIVTLQTPIHFEIAKLSDSNANSIPATIEDGHYETSPNKPGLHFELINPYNTKPFERGRTFKVQVYVTDVSSQLTGYDIAVQYDTELFEFTRIEFNNTILGGSVQGNPGLGTVEAAASGGIPYVGTRGLLFTVVFGIVFNDDASHIWGTTKPHYLTRNFSFLSTQLTFVEGTLSNGGITIGLALPVTVHLIQGDVNCDGQVDLWDLKAVANYYDTSTQPKYDLNSDGTIDIFDLVLIASNYGYPY